MLARQFHYRWEWDLRADPAALWPLVTDTNRFNHDTGVPAVAEGRAQPNAHRRLSLRRFGVLVAWEEEPFEWVRPHRFGVNRRYSAGPVAEMRTEGALTPRPGGGTHLVYQVWARPRNLLGLLAIPAQVGLLSARSFAAAFRRYDDVAVAERPSPLLLPPPVPPATLAPGGRERLATARHALLERGADAALVDRLADLVQHADAFAVYRIRPYALADHWQAPRRAVLELCLLATRVGLLNFRWELLCPLCRGNRRSGASLGDLQSQVHCESCNIDFTVNFDRSVELAFRPNPAIRPTQEATYCVGGPQVTPHIVVQQLLAPGQARALTLPLEVGGRYRLRAMSLPGGQFLSANTAGAAAASLRACPEGWPADELLLGPHPTLTFENATAAQQLIILERLAWSDQAATAAEVTSLQMFRDLFANEALRPGERIAVGSLTVLFTDLRESTRLYRESGDAVAFGQVMSHFDVLRAAIAAEQGALVKTIGDSVMAVFLRPVEGLRAVLRAKVQLAAQPGGAALHLKAGLHSGPCVAVTLNERLDYFGATVNIAARLEALAAGHPGVVVTDSVIQDPEIAAWLAEGGLVAEPFQAELKGYEGQPFQFWAVQTTA